MGSLKRFIFACACLATSASLAFCSADYEPTRVWTAADHAHPPDNLIDPTRVPQQERPNLTVGELLWQGHCARCHGPTGNGGAQAAIDFASTAWQASIDDRAIARTIAGGKPPTMPAFADLLSGSQIDELVLHIRGFGRP